LVRLSSRRFVVVDALGECHVRSIEGSMRLSTHSRHVGDALMVGLVGELDLAGRTSVMDMCALGLDRSVTVDLSGLTFMDCAGYSGLEAARQVVIGRGGTFSLTNAGDQPARLLALLDGLTTAHPGTPESGDIRKAS
jgi:anti-anti-sigma factor